MSLLAALKRSHPHLEWRYFSHHNNHITTYIDGFTLDVRRCTSHFTATVLKRRSLVARANGEPIYDERAPGRAVDSVLELWRESGVGVDACLRARGPQGDKPPYSTRQKGGKQ